MECLQQFSKRGVCFYPESESISGTTHTYVNCSGLAKGKDGGTLPTTAVHISVIYALKCVSSAWNVRVLGKNRHHSLRNVKHFPSPSDQCFQVDGKHLSAFYMRSEVADSLYICEKKCSNIINCVSYCPEFPFCVLVVTCAVCFIKKV